jgi:hypothetical protein
MNRKKTQYRFGVMIEEFVNDDHFEIVHNYTTTKIMDFETANIIFNALKKDMVKLI